MKHISTPRERELAKAKVLHQHLSAAQGLANSMDRDLGLEDALQSISLGLSSHVEDSRSLLDYHQEMVELEREERDH